MTHAHNSKCCGFSHFPFWMIRITLALSRPSSDNSRYLQGTFLVLRHAKLDNISNREVTRTGKTRFEVLTAPLLRIQVFWDVTLCGSVSGCRRCKDKLSKNEDRLPLKDEHNRILWHVTTHLPKTERQIPLDLKPHTRKWKRNAIQRSVQILPSLPWTNEALLGIELLLRSLRLGRTFLCLSRKWMRYNFSSIFIPQTRSSNWISHTN